MEKNGDEGCTATTGVGRTDERALQVEEAGKHVLVHLTTLMVTGSYQSAGKGVKARSALRTIGFASEETP